MGMISDGNHLDITIQDTTKDLKKPPALKIMDKLLVNTKMKQKIGKMVYPLT